MLLRRLLALFHFLAFFVEFYSSIHIAMVCKGDGRHLRVFKFLPSAVFW